MGISTIRTVQFLYTPSECTNRMKVAVIISALSIGACTAFDVGTRGAFPGHGCDCHCSGTVYRDDYNKVQGNCKTSDKGGRWCYVDPNYSQCNDLKPSKRFNQQWSYQACATPDLGSPQCPQTRAPSSQTGGASHTSGYGSNTGNSGFNSGSSGHGGNTGSSGFNSGSSGFNSGNSGHQGNTGSNGFNSGSSGHQGNTGSNGFNSGSSGFNSGSSGHGGNTGSSGFNSGSSG